MTPRARFRAALAGTIAVAVCCFTPLLAVTFAAIGLGALTRYLDFVLLPALAVLAIVTLVSYRRYRSSEAHRRGASESRP